MDEQRREYLEDQQAATTDTRDGHQAWKDWCLAAVQLGASKAHRWLKAIGAPNLEATTDDQGNSVLVPCSCAAFAFALSEGVGRQSTRSSFAALSRPHIIADF